MADQSEDVKNKIRRWIQEEGWGLEAHQGSGLRWFFIVTSGPNVVNLAQQTDSEDRIDITARFLLSDSDPFLFLPKSARDNTIFNICTLLAMMNLEWSGLTGEPGEKIIRSAVYYDGLTKHALVKEMVRVLNGVQLTILAIKKSCRCGHVAG